MGRPQLNPSIHSIGLAESATITAVAHREVTAEPIRILIAEMPSMLSDIVRETVASQDDMVVVGEFGERARLLRMLSTDGVDVVIVGTSEPDEPSVPHRILDVSPRIKVLMLEIRGRRAVMYHLRPHRTALGDLSPQRLLDAIRCQSTGAAHE